MFPCIRRSTPFLILSLLVLALLAPWPVQANRAASFGPTVVATVDLQRVMDSLVERADLEAALTAQSQQILEERDRRQAEIEQLGGDLEAMADGPEKARMQEDLDLKLRQEMAWIRFVQQEIDIEKSLMLENLYRSMQKNIAELADIEGIDLVLINDGNNEFSVAGGMQISRQEQLREQISLRRILYRNQSIDISDDLIIGPGWASSARGVVDAACAPFGVASVLRKSSWCCLYLCPICMMKSRCCCITISCCKLCSMISCHLVMKAISRAQLACLAASSAALLALV